MFDDVDLSEATCPYCQSNHLAFVALSEHYSEQSTSNPSPEEKLVASAREALRQYEAASPDWWPSWVEELRQALEPFDGA